MVPLRKPGIRKESGFCVSLLQPIHFKGCDWSYDVFVRESPACNSEPCLHKHVPERDVRPT